MGGRKAPSFGYAVLRLGDASDENTESASLAQRAADTVRRACAPRHRGLYIRVMPHGAALLTAVMRPMARRHSWLRRAVCGAQRVLIFWRLCLSLSRLSGPR